MNNLIFETENVQLPELDFIKIKQWIEKCIYHLKKECGDITYIFCSDDYLLEINKKYLSHDYYTDIITFDYSEGNIVSGDIFISVDRVEDNSNEFSTEIHEEYKRILIHGVLHLSGLKDNTSLDKQTMTERENYYLSTY